MLYRTTSNERGRPSSGARGSSGAEEPTYRELYEEAKRKGIEGRSKMSKSELKRVVGR